MKNLFHILLVIVFSAGTITCNQQREDTPADEEEQSNVVRKRRDDGTLSSINPVDEDGYIHGVKVNFYEDGVTVHSKITYEHGRKHGPAIWFFKNGKIYEYTNFYYGRKNGITKRYYETGELMEEVTFDSGEELPGKKTYSKDGELISG
jgi:antitoxin component YwqK of YwqJK toxin-antitoxin module